MRILFFILVFIHGLIHVLGFIKAFELSEVKQLTQPISKPLGLVWMLSFILFLITTALFIFKNNYWWLFGVVSVVISQALIIYFWQDAKFGTLANIIILVVSIIGYATANYYSQYQMEVKKNLQQEDYFSNSLLTETDLQHLPEPVKKYLYYTHSIGKPKVNTFKITFSGGIRKNEQSEWMEFSSEQYNFMKTPTRLFFMKAIMKQLPVAGYHCFNNGNAFMDIRLLSLIKVQYMDGEEMGIAETVTFFNDMCCMAPATLIDPRIKWLETDDNKVKASFTNNGITIYAWLYFNEKGELINFISNDRYAADAGKNLPWSTPLKEYKEINGYRLAGYAEAIYTYPEKNLCYGTFKLDEVKYNIEQ